MRLGAFRYPAEPTFDEAESTVEVFEGLRARVTLTDRRIVISRFGHTSIPYEDVIEIAGGLHAGPSFATLRDNETIWGGIYLLTVGQAEEWVHIPRADEAAELIRSRAPNLWPGSTHGEQITVWEWMKRVERRRAVQEVAEP